MTSAEDVERAVRDFLSDDVVAAEEAEAMEADRDLVANGVLNSLTLAHLVVFLEERFRLHVTPSEFQTDNFRSIEAISEFVRGKRGPG